MDGSEVLRAEATGSVDDPAALGQHVAEVLLNQGARALLDS